MNIQTLRNMRSMKFIKTQQGIHMHIRYSSQLQEDIFPYIGFLSFSIELLDQGAAKGRSEVAKEDDEEEDDEE